VSGIDPSTLAPWVVVAILGAFHGLNPAMGWLFAVALGFQRKSRAAVVRALFPIALGHEGSIGLTVALLGGLQIVAAPETVRVVGAVALVGFGLFKLLQPRSHPRWVGMQVSWLDLVVWSFLMSTAHGAGLMLVPVILGLPAPVDPSDQLPAVGVLNLSTVAQDGAAVLLHTGAMLLVMGAVALFVYDRIGLAVLRRAWLNVDRVWGVAVVAAGVMTLFS
jgi:hypothetical protein